MSRYKIIYAANDGTVMERFSDFLENANQHYTRFESLCEDDEVVIMYGLPSEGTQMIVMKSTVQAVQKVRDELTAALGAITAIVGEFVN